MKRGHALAGAGLPLSFVAAGLLPGSWQAAAMISLCLLWLVVLLAFVIQAHRRPPPAPEDDDEDLTWQW